VWGYSAVVLRLFACGVVLLGLVVGCGNGAGPQHSPVADQAAIEAGLRQFSHDFNARDYPAMCALFAHDVVLNYPDGGPDRGRDVFCARMRKLLSDPAKQYSYAEPDIREVLVDGDLATVALTWTLTVKNAAGKVVETIKEDGLDVFRRQPDGSWKIHISHGFANCRGVNEAPC
jgi:uncharacterized protein (TIGR02246 family)